MSKIYLFSIDSTLKAFSVVDGGVGVRYEMNAQLDDVELESGDILLGIVTQGVNEFRSSYRVVSVGDGSVELEKEVERASGVPIDSFLPQLADALQDLLSGVEIVDVEQDIAKRIHDCLMGKSMNIAKSPEGVSFQRITYGAPGTGKSHKISAVANENNSIRVTFHPDTDYSAFIGAYKPTMERAKYDTIVQVNEIVKDVNGVESVISKLKAVRKDEIVYSFVPQAFMKAYVEAWRRWCDGSMSDDDKVFYLVIEEINRGNCAQIFGDAFQLLDRCANGFSSYAIAPDHDVERFLREDKDWNLSGLALTSDVTNDEGKVVASVDQIKSGKRMVLPPNLRIWATMNTSDQSLFPMDSAFKRRWDWEYMPIKDENKGYKIKVGTGEYEWWSFLKKINDEIAEYTSSEDKQLGYFFARPKDGGNVIDTDDFVSKVIFYLWKDVFKDDLPQTKPFKYKFKEDDPEDGVEILFTHFYRDGLKDELVRHFLDELGVKKVEAQDGQPAPTEGATAQAELADEVASPAGNGEDAVTQAV